MTENKSDRDAARTAEALDTEQFQRQLQNDVRSWSANDAGAAKRVDIVPDVASNRPVKVPAVRAKKVSKQAAAVATEAKPASGKGRPFSMAYKP